jgi:phosphoglycolate phosphatase
VNQLVIFDCDGTLVDGQANICVAMEDCFARAGRNPPPRERTRRVVGLSLVEAMREMLPGEAADVHDRMAEEYKQAFHRLRAGGMVDEPLYEGITALIAALEADGWLLGVATGKSDRGLGLCLDHHGLRERFVTLQTADRHPSKPHPSMIEQAMADAGSSPGTTIMIGDTSYDMAMARAAGVAAVGVTWGYHGADELRAAGAQHIVDHPLDILSLARAMA